MQTKIKNIILIVLLIILMSWAIKVGSERQQVKDCQSWKEWASESELFQPDNDMINLCKQSGINIK